MADLTGLKLIAQGTSWTDRAVDIIAIHGLQGYDTWKHPVDGVEDSSRAIFWVKDFLPKDFPAAKIFTYNYQSTVFRDGQAITKAADKLLAKLQALQADNIETSRPLVFICHSVGGLILQCALNKVFDKKGEKAFCDITTATQGIIFLGTPHPTSDLDQSLSRIVAATKTVESIMFDSRFVAHVLVRFASLSQYNPPWKVVHCYEELPVPGTTFRAVEPSQEESWALPQLSLYSHHRDLCRFRGQDDVSYIKVVQSLKNITSGLVSSVTHDNEVQTTLSSLEHEVLESLQTEDTSAYIRDPSPGTCDWILRHDTYKSWLAEPSKLLWITGMAGSGKSTLMKHIMDSHRLKETPSRPVVSYFFSTRSANHSVTSFLSSLLHQLLKTTPSTRSFEIFSKFHQRREHETYDSTRDIDVLMENLLLLADQSTSRGGSIYVLVDALDECNDPGMLDTILWRLKNFNAGRKLRICLSSRPSNFSVPRAEIRLEDNNSLDIQRHIGEKLLCLGSHLPLPSDIEWTTKALAETAKGTFLWVSLVISHLRWGIYLKKHCSDRSSTPLLPATLDAAYETILQRLWSWHDGRHREMARDALILVLCAQRPLSILELRSALAGMYYDSDLLSPLSKNEISDWGMWNKTTKIQEKATPDINTQLMLLCGGLLELAPRQGKLSNDTTDTQLIVQFIHRTVGDFLQEKGSYILEDDYRNSKLASPQPEFTDSKFWKACYNFRIASICLGYVDNIYGRCNHLNKETAITSALFLEYSLSFGMAHLGLAERAGVDPMKKDMCWLPVFQEGFVDHWSLLHSRTFKDQRLFEPRKTKAVHIMSYYGLPWHNTGL